MPVLTINLAKASMLNTSNPKRDFALHEVIYNFVLENPRLRAKDIGAAPEIMKYVADNGYADGTVGSYISAMKGCELLDRYRVHPGFLVYEVNPDHKFDGRIIRALNRHYAKDKTVADFNVKAEWAKIEDPVAQFWTQAKADALESNVAEVLANLIKAHGASVVCAAIPKAIQLAEVA